MHCDRARELIGPHIDGELAGAERQAIAEHLQSCAECGALAQDLARIGRQIAAAGREPAPKALALRIRAALAEEAQSMERLPAPQSADLAPDLRAPDLRAPDLRAPDLRAPDLRARGLSVAEARAAEPLANVARLPTASRHSWGAGFARQAAALATACVLSSALTYGVTTWSGAHTRLDGDIVSAHVRSLLQESPIQIASSDSHTVKPWFNGRIDFAPDFKDLAAEGFPLLGGRLDYIGERRVGAIVYRRRLHVVNVFMWPAPSAEAKPPRVETAKGYNLLSWSRNGVTYWAVSDLNSGELSQLQSLM